MSGTQREAMQRIYDAVYRLLGDPVAWVERTRERMARYQITQGALARRAGVEPIRVSNWVGTRSVKPLLENRLLLDEALLDLIEITAGPEAVEEELAR